jgi:hypothetical protein
VDCGCLMAHNQGICVTQVERINYM